MPRLLARLPQAPEAEEPPEETGSPWAGPEATQTAALLRELRGGPDAPRGAPTPAPTVRRAPDLAMLRPVGSPAAAPAADTVAAPAQPRREPSVDLSGALQGLVESASAEQPRGQAAPAIDIEAIAQKVYEHLRRRLRIDQERLGRY